MRFGGRWLQPGHRVRYPSEGWNPSGNPAAPSTAGRFLASPHPPLNSRYSTVMSRLGQGTLRITNHHVGMVWVSRLAAEVAFHPRILLSAGCQLQEVSTDQMSREGLKGFRIAALGGQLRWRSETGPVVGDLSIPKGLEHLRSAAHSSEHQFTMSCDVPHQILSRLEAERGGASPVFWMDLAGSWALDGSIEPIYQSPWQFVVPTDMWIAFLAESGYHDFDVIELRRVLKEGGTLQGAVDHLNAARRLVASDPPRAVGICRLLIEAVEAALKDHGYKEVAKYLTVCTDERRGKQFAKIVSSVKQLAAMTHHEFGRDSVFTRHEALALVRICEALLLMVGEMTRPAGGSSEEDDEG